MFVAGAQPLVGRAYAALRRGATLTDNERIGWASQHMAKYNAGGS